MATTSTSTAVAPVGPVFTEPERLPLAGFLTGYSGLSRETYALDLRQFTSWCQQRRLRLFQIRRADIECFARDLEARSRARVRQLFRAESATPQLRMFRRPRYCAAPPYQTTGRDLRTRSSFLVRLMLL
jgi:hypothetical protein